MNGELMATAGLRKQYADALEKFHFYERGLLIAKQDVQETIGTHPSCYTDEQRTAIAEYDAYKFVVKCQSSELRELKHAIREYDRTHSSIALT
jgi:hypothetical protein